MSFVLLMIGAFLFPPLLVAEEGQQSPAANRSIDFARDIQPILAAACYRCHGSEQQQSNYRLDSRRSALGTGDIGEPPIVPGKSHASPLIDYVTGRNEELVMPADGERLTDEQIVTLRNWIDQGAAWPESADNPQPTPTHWSLRPLTRPAIPAPEQWSQVQTPVDAFLLTQLESQGLTYSAPADRTTLIRRVTYDLTGLPPSIADVEAFLADRSPNAYRDVVERLLSSPQYGERWARHWFDVIHYAESHGNDQDRPRPNAWPYRDYVIRSLNDDLPYAQFVRQQIAADVLCPEQPAAIAALGFLAAGPWDESSQMGILDDTIDKKIAQVLDRDDMLTTVMGALCGTTVQCARCHNHKFDPITQADYYSLQAVFAGVDRAERPFDADPAVARQRRALAARREQINRLDAQQLAVNSELVAEIGALEQTFAVSRTAWRPLSPLSVTSTGGASHEIKSDNSVLFTGDRPDRDTYHLRFTTDIGPITAVRVEVLADPSLPQQGPGRTDNGNLHLSEFRLAATTQPGATPEPISIASAIADFNQEGWDVARAIDRNPDTAWGIFPAVGNSHVAIFLLHEPLLVDQPRQLDITLEQLHGGGHVIGRVRVSVTSAASPVAEPPVPAALVQTLEKLSADRTQDEQLALAKHLLTAKLERDEANLPPVGLVYAATNYFKADGNFRPPLGPRPVHLLRRGDIHQPVAESIPGALACIEGLSSRFSLPDAANEQLRRAALAEWIVDSRNVLTWRTIVNRVWHYHFGRGICDSPNDLGRMGGVPSHPELLDWLAVEFLEGGGSLKELHRTLVLSTAYQQSSTDNQLASQLDADNRWLWRMNRTRLDAESIRDSILSVSGKLDLTMHGPSVKHFVESPGIHVTPHVDYLSYNLEDVGNQRRSIYRFLFRTVPDPFMESMDCPDGSQLSPIRQQSVTALQALSMFNNRLLIHQSEYAAARIVASRETTVERVELLFKLAIARAPSEAEVARWSAYIARHGWANACRLMFNTNEFMFVN